MADPKKLPRIGSAVVVVEDDRVLLGTRAKEPNRGKWILPGGKIEPFESIDSAAKREIREETGLEIDLEGTLTIKEIINPPDEHRIIVYSQARPTSGDLRAGSDLDDVRFCRAADLHTMDLSETVREVLYELGWIRFEAVAA
jgi:ADP-ribose pyrophosphatase YjhB (NUDIX family)